MNTHGQFQRAARCFPRAVAALAAVALLQACGGGGGSGDNAAMPQDNRTLPITALANAGAYTLFVMAQLSADAVTPLELGDAVAPVSETEAPLALE